MILDLDVVDRKNRSKLEKLGVEYDDMTNAALVAAAMVNAASRGDVAAARFVNDLAGDGAEGTDKLDEILDEVRRDAE